MHLRPVKVDIRQRRCQHDLPQARTRLGNYALALPNPLGGDRHHLAIGQAQPDGAMQACRLGDLDKFIGRG